MLYLQVDPADVVIVEGILVLHVPELRDILNMKIYVDTGGLHVHLQVDPAAIVTTAFTTAFTAAFVSALLCAFIPCCNRTPL
jgi:hypothetical protein